MEITNNYLLLTAGLALILAALFNVGAGFDGLSTFGFVPITGWGALVNNLINAVSYVLGFWMVIDAVRKIRKS